jgi:dTDP-4-amino-4,6-dideoxygalactose transaminase
LRNNFLVFGSPLIGDEEIFEVNETLESGWLGTGPKVKKFEQDFSLYKKVNYSLGLNSCTAALHLSLLSLNLNFDDEVITSAMTFCATVNTVIHAGGKPVLVDVNPTTMNMTPENVEKAITKKTKAILIVHFAGYPCDMDEFLGIANKYDLEIIEDCAHAIETIYKGKSAGTFGRYGCFSFYATKNITTGEGGMVITNDELAFKRLKTLSLHGMSQDAWNRFGNSGYKHYDVEECGFKYNMMDLQASIGIHQLKNINSMWEKRKKVWDLYIENLNQLPILLPSSDVDKNSKHAYHLFTIQIDESLCGVSRDTFLTKMKDFNIGLGVHYRSIAEHSYYRTKYGWNPEKWPFAFNIGLKTVSLPISPRLKEEDVFDVIESIKLVIK